jgi:hypothetical protein
MSHNVVCQNDAVNYDYAVIVDDKIATTYPYKSWYLGGGQTTAEAAAENLTLKLAAVFAENAATHTVEVEDNGSGYDVALNNKVVTTYGYSGVWVVGGLIASKTQAKASAYQLGQNLSSILQVALKTHE